MFNLKEQGMYNSLMFDEISFMKYWEITLIRGKNETSGRQIVF